MNNRRAVYGARVILATRIVDTAYQWFTKLRSELVLSLASDAVLAEFNNLTYGTQSSYNPRSDIFRAYLFPWEEAVIARFFPDPPARVLIGGAGGGREVWPLAQRGYDVVAFEPSGALTNMMMEHLPADLHVQVYRAAYGDLPHLHGARPGDAPATLSTLAPFDAALIGWGSFAHLPNTAARAHTLKAFAAVTNGPIVVSFLQFRTAPPASTSVNRLRQRLRRWRNRTPGDQFAMYVGFYHEIDEEELIALARQANVRIAHLSTDSRDTNWPHAVFLPPEHHEA